MITTGYVDTSFPKERKKESYEIYDGYGNEVRTKNQKTGKKNHTSPTNLMTAAKVMTTAQRYLNDAYAIKKGQAASKKAADKTAADRRNAVDKANKDNRHASVSNSMAERMKNKSNADTSNIAKSAAKKVLSNKAGSSSIGKIDHSAPNKATKKAVKGAAKKAAKFMKKIFG